MPRSWVTTATGGVFDFDLLLEDRPQPQPLRMEDFSIPLSRVPRWMGIVPVKIGEHVSQVSRRCEEIHPVAAAAGLLHDCMEPFQADVPSPLKQRYGMCEYNDIEHFGMRYIMRSFGLMSSWVDATVRSVVDRADAEMFACEVRDHAPPLPNGYTYNLRHPAPDHFSFLNYANEAQARMMFEARWIELGIPKVGAA